jgi:uncharacterized RDD family membrane protein YckC
MTSMPQGDGPEQWGGAQQSGRPGERTSSGTQHGTMPGEQDYGGTPSGGIEGQQTGAFPGQQQETTSGQRYGSQPGQRWGNQPGWASPVNEAETRVTGRRIVQYWIDAFLVYIIPYLVSIPFDRSSSTLLHVLGGVVALVLFLLIGIWYWVIRPHSHNGQTFAMKWFGLRVISKEGGPANIAQMFVRWICLIFDSFPWVWPFTGLLGLIVMLCSRYRQRIGDHLGRTLVISTGALGNQNYAHAGQSGMGGQAGTGGQSGMGGQAGMGGQSGMSGQSGMGGESVAGGQRQDQFEQQQYGRPDRNS